MEGAEQIIKSQHMLKCPYDPNHNVPKETFFKHLDKCKSPYKDLFVQCPFNPFHWPKKDTESFRRHCKGNSFPYVQNAPTDSSGWNSKSQVQDSTRPL